MTKRLKTLIIGVNMEDDQDETQLKHLEATITKADDGCRIDFMILQAGSIIQLTGSNRQTKWHIHSAP